MTDEHRYLTNVSDVTYPDGSVGPCYALVGETGTGAAVSVRRAIELQREGIPFRQPHPVYPADFTTWFAPDFPAVMGGTGATGRGVAQA